MYVIRLDRWLQKNKGLEQNNHFKCSTAQVFFLSFMIFLKCLLFVFGSFFFVLKSKLGLQIETVQIFFFLQTFIASSVWPFLWLLQQFLCFFSFSKEKSWQLCVCLLYFPTSIPNSFSCLVLFLVSFLPFFERDVPWKRLFIYSINF